MNEILSKYIKEIEKFSLEDFQKARIKKISKTLISFELLIMSGV